MTVEVNAPQSSVARLLAMDPSETKLDVNHVAMQFTGDMTRVAAHFAETDAWNASEPTQRLQDAILRNLLPPAVYEVAKQFREAQTGSEENTLADAINAVWVEVVK